MFIYVMEFVDKSTLIITLSKVIGFIPEDLVLRRSGEVTGCDNSITI
jgi:hypothetical protein